MAKCNYCRKRIKKDYVFHLDGVIGVKIKYHKACYEKKQEENKKLASIERM